MKYDELITNIQTPMLPVAYYKTLLDNAEAIVIQVSVTSKSQVAKDLGMSAQVFATAIKFISASVK